MDHQRSIQPQVAAPTAEMEKNSWIPVFQCWASCCRRLYLLIQENGYCLYWAKWERQQSIRTTKNLPGWFIWQLNETYALNSHLKTVVLCITTTCLSKNYMQARVSQHLNLGQILLLAGLMVGMALKWKLELDLHITEHTVSQFVEVSHSPIYLILHWKRSLKCQY